MMKNLLATALWCICSITAYAQDIATPQNEVQPSRLIKNTSFEDEIRAIRNRRFGPNGEGELFGGRMPEGYIPGWLAANDDVAASAIELTTENLLDDTQQKALQWTIAEATETTPATLMNVGFHGIEVTKGQKYTLTFWARANKCYKGHLCVGLMNKRHDEWCAQATMKGKIKKRWKKYTITLVADKDNERARFVMTADKAGTLYLDEVQLTLAN